MAVGRHGFAGATRRLAHDRDHSPGPGRHPVEIAPPPGISFELENPTHLSVVGIDKQLVGEVAAAVRSSRKPEPYKGKGVRYAGEQVRRKAGKAGKIGGKK